VWDCKRLKKEVLKVRPKKVKTTKRTSAEEEEMGALERRRG